MGCLSVNIRRIGGASGSAHRVGGMSCLVERIGDMTCRTERIAGDVSAVVERCCGMTARVGLVCTTNIDIRPGILWASDGRLITLEGGFLIPNGR